MAGAGEQASTPAKQILAGNCSPTFGGDGWYRFGYDALDNLRTWTLPGEGQRRYDYDASNRRMVVRNASGAAIIGLGHDVQGNLSIKSGQGYQFDRHYLYSRGGPLAYLWDQGTGETTQYIQLGGSLVATRTQAASGAVSVKYQHTDALGSPVAETNEQAAVVKRTAYTPYGASIGATVHGVGYAGHVMDGSTGLTYMQQRYVDPAIGAFLSVDPVTTSCAGRWLRFRSCRASGWCLASCCDRCVGPVLRACDVGVLRAGQRPALPSVLLGSLTPAACAPCSTR